MTDIVIELDDDLSWLSGPRFRTEAMAQLLPEATPDGLLAPALAHLELPECSDDLLLDAAAGWERVMAYAAGMQARVLAEFAARRPPEPREGLSCRRGDPPLIPVPEGVPEASRTAGAEVSLELNLSPGAAAWRVGHALTLVHRLPRLLDALCAGTISLPHARAVLAESGDLPAADAAAVVNRVLDRAEGKTHQQLRAAAKRAAHAVNPNLATERRQRAAKDRRVEFSPDENGMAWINALLPAVDAAAIEARLDQAARTTRTAGDDRTLDQLRADALVEAVLHGAGPAARPLINITMPAGSMLGLSDQPAELAGYGPIDTDYARTVAGSGMWRRIVTDPATGIATDIGTTYRPPKKLRNLIRARYPDCPFPTCTTPAHRTDFDHLEPHGRGGQTAAKNGATPCRQHHRTKHTPGWRVRKRPDHSIEWTTPTGKTHIQAPATFDEPPPF